MTGGQGEDDGPPMGDAEAVSGIGRSPVPFSARPAATRRRVRDWIPTAVAVTSIGALYAARARPDETMPGNVAFLVGFVIVVVCGIVALVQIWSSTAPAAITLVAVIAWFVVAFSGVPHNDYETDPLKGRDLAAYEQQARDALADPPMEVPDEEDVPFVASNGRFSAVAWIESRGLVGRSSGLVYDPQGALRAGAVLDLPDHSFQLDEQYCDHLRGPWYSCRLA